MRKEISLFLISLIGGFLFLLPQTAFAQSEDNIVVIYSIDNEEQMNEVRILDAIVGQFVKDYQLIQDEEVTSENVQNASYLIYYGVSKVDLPKQAIKLIDDFDGYFYAIGHNVEQFEDKLSWMDTQVEILIDSFKSPHDKHIQNLPEERIIYHTDTSEENIWMQAIGVVEQNEIPLVVQHNAEYYFSAQSLFYPFDGAATESFRDFFNEEEEELLRYLRLEDVHPMVDANQLKEQAEYLKVKDIPYMVAVIPVYRNDGETIHLSESPELVKTLQYMQDNGASIVLHGYKHQYRSSETGEGFEFWDVENDRPIYQSEAESVKLKGDFATEEEYLNFVEEGEAFEKTYIEDAIRNGVEELVAHGLYPLAFEAPHYAMSEHGYEILSQHFSSYVGRLQLTNHTWESEYVPLYESTPKFLYGMKVYPETVGFIDQSNEFSLAEMQEQIENMQRYSQSYISAFYHPYMGLEGLKEVVESLESAEDATWFDLKERENFVQVKDIEIESNDGKIEVTKPFIVNDYEKKLKIKQSMIYVIPGIVLFIVITFVLIKKFRSKNKS